jgi:hypothetical protein
MFDLMLLRRVVISALLKSHNLRELMWSLEVVDLMIVIVSLYPAIIVFGVGITTANVLYRSQFRYGTVCVLRWGWSLFRNVSVMDP